MTNLFRVCGIFNIVPSLTSPLPLHTLSQQFLQLSFEPTGQRTSLISAIAEQKHHSRDITPHFSLYSLLSVLASLVIAFIPTRPFSQDLFPTLHTPTHSCRSQDPSVRQWLWFHHVVRLAVASRNEGRVPMDTSRTMAKSAQAIQQG